MKKIMGVVAIVGSVVLSGCVFAPEGGGSRNYGRGPQVAQPTIGQELLDLDRARQAGVITETEFDRAKSRLIDGSARN